MVFESSGSHDIAVMRPHRRPPLPFLRQFRTGLSNQLPQLSQQVAAPIREFFDLLGDKFSGGACIIRFCVFHVLSPVEFSWFALISALQRARRMGNSPYREQHAEPLY
jgi:hypothetical protein